MENNKNISNGVKKLGTYFLYGGALFFVIALVYMSINTKEENNQNTAGEQTGSAVAVESQNTKSAEKIQVFLFHTTQRCITCVTIGKYANETVEQKFPEEVKSGKIEFREINIDLPENKELANKFKATGSALFINPIIEGKDNIQVDTQVWRLTSNKQAFISYLSDKINALF